MGGAGLPGGVATRVHLNGPAYIQREKDRDAIHVNTDSICTRGIGGFFLVLTGDSVD